MIKTFSEEFQREILDLFTICMDNNSDTLEIKFDYPTGTIEVEMTFRAYKKGGEE